jgi:hypothetical protein
MGPPNDGDMSFTLTMSGVIVGRSELERRDPATRVVRGVFRPGLGYELAQPVFSLYENAHGDQASLVRYRRAREALRLQLTDATGTPVSFRELHIQATPAATSGGAEYVMEIVSDDPVLWTTSAQS